jgi:xanthine dehydrogenase accessory factor
MNDWIRVTVTKALGSTPREAGAWMKVDRTGQSGTIGGGALEWEATRIARDMLASGLSSTERTLPLGPNLGQCCGGSVVLTFEADANPDPPSTRPLWIWGAGHVGRALISVLAPMPEVAVTWLDTARTRFPDDIAEQADVLVSKDLPRAFRHAPLNAHHLIVTYSHDIDLALCHTALGHGFASAGLIGSATKWARFRARLKALDHSDAEIDRITCPIGDPTLGKHPQAIAVGVAARFLAPEVARG